MTQEELDRMIGEMEERILSVMIFYPREFYAGITKLNFAADDFVHDDRAAAFAQLLISRFQNDSGRFRRLRNLDRLFVPRFQVRAESSNYPIDVRGGNVIPYN